MPPIQIDITTELKTTNKFLQYLLSGLPDEINNQVTDFITEQSKEMASGSEIYNVPESPEMKDRIQNEITLSSKIKSKQVSKIKGKSQSKVICDSEHASWVEWGTGLHGELEAPHRIYPREKKVMTWIGENGERVFAASTAGQYPKPFMRGAIFKLKATIRKVLGFSDKITEVPSTQNQMFGLSGLGKLNMGLHSQVNAKPESSSKMWDQPLRSQIKRK